MVTPLASTGQLPAGATEGLVMEALLVMVSRALFPGRLISVSSFAPTKPLQCSFVESQNNSPGQETS